MLVNYDDVSRSGVVLREGGGSCTSCHSPSIGQENSLCVMVATQPDITNVHITVAPHDPIHLHLQTTNGGPTAMVFTTTHWLHQQCLGFNALNDDLDRHHVYGSISNAMLPSFTLTQSTGHATSATYPTVTMHVMIVDDDLTRAVWKSNEAYPFVTEEKWSGTQYTVTISAEPPPGVTTKVLVSSKKEAQMCVENPTLRNIGGFENTCVPIHTPLSLLYTSNNWEKKETVVLRSLYDAATEQLVDNVKVVHQIQTTSTTDLGSSSTVLPTNAFQVAVVDLPTVTHMTPKSAPSSGGRTSSSSSRSSSTTTTTSEQAPAVQYWHRRLPSVPSAASDQEHGHRRLSSIADALATPGLVQVHGFNFGNSNPGAVLMVDGVEGGTSIWRSSSHIDFLAPAGTGSDATVTLRFGDQIMSVAGFSFSYNPPIVYSVNSFNAPTSGHTYVTFIGLNFGTSSGSIDSVQIEGQPCEKPTIMSDTEFVCIAPPLQRCSRR